MEHLFTSDKIVETLISAGARIALALIVYVIGRIVIGKFLKFLDRMKSVRKIDPTAASFVHNFIKILLYIVLAVSVIGILGVPMASIVAVLASVGLAIGMAMQGALSNFAGGMMLLIFRPFNVGDYIMAGGVEGTVSDITMMYTILTTIDNKTISIPNGSLMNDKVVNCTHEDRRRVELEFDISSDTPVDDVRWAMMQAISRNAKILDEPGAYVQPIMPVSGGLKYSARAWVMTVDYWDVYYELMREIPAELSKANIEYAATPIDLKERK